MGTGMPELGSKISLISKADIRYEGRLFTVDPQECTIALASVRSFGTEERETQYPVPAQNQVYDYILFRGSDIKDIRVINSAPTLPNDPAIMQLSVPPSLGQQQFPPQTFSHPVLGPMGPQMAHPFAATGYGALGMMGGMQPPPQGGFQSSNGSRDFRAMQQPTNTATCAAPGAKPTSVLDLIGGGSRSTTPASLGSRKSPTADQGVQTAGSERGGVGGGGAKKDEKKTTVKPIQPPHRNQHHQQRQQHSNNNNNSNNSSTNNQRKDSSSDGAGRDRQQNRPAPMQQQQQQHTRGQQQQRHHHQVQYHGNRGQQQQPQQQQQLQQQQQQHWGQVQRGGGMQQRARGRPRGNVQSHGGGSYRQHQTQGGAGTGSGGAATNPAQGDKQKTTLKFENDYDFEQANTQFEELKNQLEKLKLKESGSGDVNGDVEKKEDSGNETGAGEGEQEDDSRLIFYDKAVSFFDNISCEAVERSKGRSQRTDWKAERKLNSETFGVASTRRNLNFYRGRSGGYYNRGFRGSYRGGYRNSSQNQHLQRNINKQQQQQQQEKSNVNQTKNNSSNKNSEQQTKEQQQQQQQQSSTESGSQSVVPAPPPVPASTGN